MSKTVQNTSINEATQNDDEIDLFALLLALLRGWKIILTFTLLSFILGLTYSRYVQPTYKSDALLQIDKESKGISALGSNISDLVGTESSPAETERELIMSRMVLKPVVDNLHLDIKISNPELTKVDRILQSKTPTQINDESGVTLDTKQGIVDISTFEVPRAYENRTFQIRKTNVGFELSIEVDDELQKYTGKIHSSNTIITPEGNITILVNSLPKNGNIINLTKVSVHFAINELSNSLSVVEQGKGTGILKLDLKGQDQQQVSNVLSKILKSYINQNLERGTQQTSTTIEFMESQVPQLKQKLEQSEEVFNNFREKYGTLDVSKEAEILLNESSQIERQLSDLNLKKADLLTYYTSEHPLVIQINDQLKVLTNRRAEIQDTITGLPEVQREFLQLSQDVEINREIYLTMLKNYEQLKIARAGEIGYARIIDLPVNTFKPIAPRKVIILALSLIIGTLLGSLLVLVKNLLRNTVKDPERLEAKTGVPVIATIPRSKTSINLIKNNKNNRRLLATIDHDGLSYEGIKSLRTSLIFAMPSVSKVAKISENISNNNTAFAAGEGKVIVVSGEAPGIGKSFISSNLAETFSQLNKKVLVLDGDMRRGELHKIFTVDQSNGLGDYLTEDNTDLSNFIHPTGFEFIDFMPRGKHPHNPASLLSTEKFASMMSQLIAIYDYIIIDTPPVLAVSDAIIIAQFADKVLLVTRYNHSIEGQLAYAVKQMNKANVTVDGIVLNDMVQGITNKYSYHYSYAYGNSKD